MHAIERAEIKLGDSVVIQGSGPVGLNAIALAQLQGAGLVIAIGAPALRLEMAKAMGADEIVDISEYGPAERVKRVQALTGGRGADVTIEATGVPAAVREGMQMTRDAGRFVVVGQYTDVGGVEINPHWDLNRKHLEVRGCWGSDFSHFYRGRARGGPLRRAFPLGSDDLRRIQPGAGRAGAGRCGAAQGRQGVDQAVAG